MSAVRALLFVACLATVAAEPIVVGITEAELLASKGKPEARSVLGTKAIYRWPDAEVTLVDGLVIKVVERDLTREAKAEQAAIARNAAEQEKKRAKAEKLRAEAAQQTADSLMAGRTYDGRVREESRYKGYTGFTRGQSYGPSSSAPTQPTVNIPRTETQKKKPITTIHTGRIRGSGRTQAEAYADVMSRIPVNARVNSREFKGDGRHGPIECVVSYSHEVVIGYR